MELRSRTVPMANQPRQRSPGRPMSTDLEVGSILDNQQTQLGPAVSHQYSNREHDQLNMGRWKPTPLRGTPANFEDDIEEYLRRSPICHPISENQPLGRESFTMYRPAPQLQQLVDPKSGRGQFLPETFVQYTIKTSGIPNIEESSDEAVMQH